MKLEILRCVHLKMLETKPLNLTDFKKSIRQTCPCPEPDSASEFKYNYFYNPYTKTINTDKFIKYSDQDENPASTVNIN